MSGFQGHGKDAFAGFLSDFFGFKRYAFADKLKQTAAFIFNIPIDYFYDRELKDVPLQRWPHMSPRAIVQRLGTQSLRDNFDKEIWIRLISQQIAMEVAKIVHANTSSPMRLKYVITDVRFPNEAMLINFIIEELRNHNIIDRVCINKINLKVVRKNFDFWERMHMRLFGHKSDYTMFDMKFDGEIPNFGDLADLAFAAKEIYKHTGWKFMVEQQNEG